MCPACQKNGESSSQWCKTVLTGDDSRQVSTPERRQRRQDIGAIQRGLDDIDFSLPIDGPEPRARLDHSNGAGPARHVEGNHKHAGVFDLISSAASCSKCTEDWFEAAPIEPQDELFEQVFRPTRAAAGDQEQYTNRSLHRRISRDGIPTCSLVQFKTGPSSHGSTGVSMRLSRLSTAGFR